MLHGAVAGIAEVINNPGLVNVDFADVRTVMGEVGMAMMGSATAAGADRARIAAEQAVASPLLEDVNLAGARGVLVNITASAGLKMKEYHEVMNTIKEFTADDAMVIVGTVIDDAMERRAARDDDRDRPGRRRAARTAAAATRGRRARSSSAPAPTTSACRSRPIDYDELDQPGGDPARPHAVAERRRRRRSTLGHPGVPAQAGGLSARRRRMP